MKVKKKPQKTVEEIKIEIGQALARKRRSKNLTQRGVAKKVNLAPSSYSDYERGENLVPIDKLIILADFYGCSIDSLIGRDITKFEHKIYNNAIDDVINLLNKNKKKEEKESGREQQNNRSCET